MKAFNQQQMTTLIIMPSEEAATVKKKKTGKPTKNCSCKMGITGVAKRGGQIQLKRCLDAPLIKL